MTKKPAQDHIEPAASEERFVPASSVVREVERLLEESWAACTVNPSRTEALARQALSALGRDTIQDIDPKEREDLRARAWIYIANSRRIRGDFEAAHRMLTRADSLLQSGSHSPLFRAELLLIEAGLANERRQFTEAEDKLDQVIAIYRWNGNRQKVGLVLLTKVNMLYTSGRTEECLECLDQAEELLDFELEPWSHFSVLQMRAVCLNDLGRMEEAEKLLPKVHLLVQRCGTELDKARVLWLEAMVMASKGRISTAEDLYRTVRDRFMRDERSIDAALVSLDLAALLLEAGRVGETRELAEEMLPLFESLDIRREAFAALILFQRAALHEQATAEMARDIATYLKRVDTTPALKYEAPS